MRSLQRKASDLESTGHALGAASWNARAWLGHAGIEEGAPADIVVFAEDPRVTISVVREPVLIILNGRVVGGSAAN